MSDIDKGLIEAVATAIEPNAFLQDHRQRHVYCSPMSVDSVQNKARETAASVIRVVQAAPVPMILYCPACGTQHIDAPSPGADLGEISFQKWDNPPHRSHLCGACGHIWRPADVPTTGVHEIKTKGKNDSNIVFVGVPERVRRFEEVVKGFLSCPEIADCAPEDKDDDTIRLESEAMRLLNHE